MFVNVNSVNIELKVDMRSVKELKFRNTFLCYIAVQVNVSKSPSTNSKFYDLGCYAIIKDHYMM